MDKTHFVKLQLSRLVNLLAPHGLSADAAQNLVEELLSSLTRYQAYTTTNSVEPLLQDYEHLFASHGRSRDWSHFKIIIQILGEKKSPEDIARYLTFLSHLLPDSGTFSGARRHDLAPILDTTPLSLSQRTQGQSLSAGKPASSSVAPRDNESCILDSLQYTLVGQETRLLKFSPDYLSIEIPADMGKCFSNLLADVLEPALLFSTLQNHLERVKGSEKSPIKTAFTRSLESYLKDYANHIQSVFATNPTSLFAVLDQLTDQVRDLRLLSYLNDRSVELDGFQFLEEVYKASQSGDISVTHISKEIFRQIVAPYYEYIEHWIIKGRLIDGSNEFFVFFNTGENHINDIIAFDVTKFPSFMHYERSTFSKIFQIGKTLIFLEKYCEEQDWVNSFASKYFFLVFNAHEGLISMSSAALQELVNAQFSEVVNYLAYLLQHKYHIFHHLRYLKKIMLMEASDLIDNINKNGSPLFSEPAMSLTSGKLSDILDASIDGSSLKATPGYFRDRIDARILDLSHGTVGWDVFTLDYKIPEASLDAIVNYKNDSTQYLRLFNFLWSLKHFQFILSNNFLDFQILYRNDLRVLQQQCRDSKFDLKRLQWLKKSVRMISIIRNRMFLLLQAIFQHVTLSLIETSFNSKIFKAVFKNVSSHESSVGSHVENTKLAVLNPDYAAECKGNNQFQRAQSEAFIEHDMRELTIDEWTSLHSDYLQSITNCKLFREDIIGRHSGDTFVDQIFAFLETIYSFVQTSEEFGILLNKYVNLFSVSGDRNFEDSLEETHSSMRVLMRKAHQEIYMQRFAPSLLVFQRDLRCETELKDLSKFV